MTVIKNLTVKQNKIIVAVAAVILVVIDQIIKIIVLNNMDLHESIPIIKNVLHLTYVLNDGAAFSFLSGQAWILCGVTSVFMAVLIYVFVNKKSKHPLLIYSLGLIISGGIGNLIDRFFRGETLFYGKVIDYIDFRIINFAVFNFADCCVCIGAALMIVYVIFFDKEKPEASGTEVVSEVKGDE